MQAEPEQGKRKGLESGRFLADLEALSGPVDQATAAFERLSAETRPMLERYLHRYRLTTVDRDDLAQIVLGKIWTSRTGFQSQGEAGWWKFVKIIADRSAADEGRKPWSGEEGVEWMEEVPLRDEPYLDAIVAAIADRDALYRTADEIWLGVPRQVSAREYKARLLAAQLYYLHGASLEEIAQVIPRLDGRETTAEALDACLVEKSVLLCVAFGHLCYENDALAACLLCPERPLSILELDEIAHNIDTGPPPGGWTWDEVRILLWRIRNGLLTEQILRFSECRVSRERLEELLERFRRFYPFAANMRRIVRNFPPQAIKWLAEPGLWRRLAFQYYAANDLPQQQILERMTPAAEVIQRKLSPGMLNMWISGDRLAAQLAAGVGEEQ